VPPLLSSAGQLWSLFIWARLKIPARSFFPSDSNSSANPSLWQHYSSRVRTSRHVAFVDCITQSVGWLPGGSVGSSHSSIINTLLPNSTQIQHKHILKHKESFFAGRQHICRLLSWFQTNHTLCNNSLILRLSGLQKSSILRRVMCNQVFYVRECSKT